MSARVVALLLMATPAVAADPPAATVDAFGDPLPPGAAARLGTARAAVNRYYGSLALPPAFTRVVTRTPFGELVVRDAVTGRTVCRPAPVGSRRWFPEPIAVSADGSRAVGENGRGAFVWDTTTGRAVRTVAPDGGPGPNVTRAALSGDGTVLAVGLPTGKTPAEVVVWDVATGAVRTRVAAAGWAGPTPVLSADGKTLATWDDTVGPSAGAGEVRVWDAVTGKERSRVRVSRTIVGLAVLSADGALLATRGTTGVGLWDARTGAALPLAPGGGVNPGVAGLAFAADGGTVAAIGFDGAVRRWATAGGRLLDTTACPVPHVLRVGGTPRGVAFPANGRTAAYAVIGQTAVSWDVPSGKLLTPPGEHTAAVTGIGFRPGGEVVTSADDGRVVRWAAATGRPLGMVALRPVVPDPPGRPPNRPLRISPDAARGLAGRLSGPTAAFDLRTGAELFVVPTVPPGLRVSGVPSPDLSRVAVWETGRDGDRDVVRCAVWDVATGKKVAAVVPSESPRPDPLWDRNRAVAFSPDGARLVTTVRLDDQPPAPTAARVRGGGRPIAPVATAGIAVTGWDVATGRKLGEWYDPGAVQPVAVAAVTDTSAVIATSDDRLWVVDFERGVRGEDLASPGRPGDESAAWWGAAGRLGPIAVAADGKRFAVGGPFGPADEIGVRVYDWPSGNPVRTFTGHAGPVTALTFSPDGRTLASGSADTTVLLWDVSALGPPGKP